MSLVPLKGGALDKSSLINKLMQFVFGAIRFGLLQCIEERIWGQPKGVEMDGFQGFFYSTTWWAVYVFQILGHGLWRNESRIFY